MAIPVHLQKFKAAGIYRVVFDKSTILNEDTQILRLVVGYSEKGPFNVPVLVKDTATFKALYGDISKKLEKRGIFFHRLALQMLAVSPILCLNLKKFDGEQVTGATIATDFNPTFEPIETVHLNVEDVYDTTRFWKFDEDKLNDLRSVEGKVMDQYINITATNTVAQSNTFFIRKASGNKVSTFNITVNDWYSDSEMPEFLKGHENNKMSDFFAEIYVFKGKFTAKQVLASSSLKNYFVVDNVHLTDDDQPTLSLRDKVFNAYGEAVDTLDALYADETSGALGHWVGSLIPEFVDKNNNVQSLNILFNNDADIHNMMLSFNTELLEEGNCNIDLSGRLSIPINKSAVNKLAVGSSTIDLVKIYNGEATSTVLGNVGAPIIADRIDFGVNVLTSDGSAGVIPFDLTAKSRVSGTMYVSNVDLTDYRIKLVQVKEEDSKFIVLSAKPELIDTEEMLDEEKAAAEKENTELKDKALKITLNVAKRLGVTFDSEDKPVDMVGTYFSNGNAFDEEDILRGPEKVITSISRLEFALRTIYTDNDDNMRPSFMDVECITKTEYLNPGLTGKNSVYGSSVSFIDFKDENWQYDEITINQVPNVKALYSTERYDKSLITVLNVGDCLIANDGVVDFNENEVADDADGRYDNVYVQEIGTDYYLDGELDLNAIPNTDGKYADDAYHKEGDFKCHYVIVSNTPKLYVVEPTDEAYSSLDSDLKVNKFIIRFDAPLNQEIGTMKPQYLEGYTYKNDRPNGTGMWAKVQWQNFILSTLTDYKGLRTGILNKSEIDYRYIIDTFQSFPTSGLKKTLSYLAKEKQSAFCISNFPSVQTFVKCPYTSFTDDNGVFNVKYVVDGYNKKKSASERFSLPGEADGASFIAFYTPLKFSDGYVDNIVPSAGLVSNLFVEKYMSRQPYYIIAGPNYGAISASGLVGPDYKYSQEELFLIEPYGVNCMIYRPSFGTFINANQTAKQTPVSALSKVHVRELVIYLQDEIEKVLQQYQWEFNNQRTRNAVLDRVNNICELVMANGGLQDYQNIMDESNNTPEIIDNEMAVISTHIEPGMGCGKMVQELTLYRTGQMRSMLSES